MEASDDDRNPLLGARVRVLRAPVVTGCGDADTCDRIRPLGHFPLPSPIHRSTDARAVLTTCKYICNPLLQLLRRANLMRLREHCAQYLHGMAWSMSTCFLFSIFLTRCRHGVLPVSQTIQAGLSRAAAGTALTLVCMQVSCTRARWSAGAPCCECAPTYVAAPTWTPPSARTPHARRREAPSWSLAPLGFGRATARAPVRPRPRACTASRPREAHSDTA